MPRAQRLVEKIILEALQQKIAKPALRFIHVFQKVSSQQMRKKSLGEVFGVGRRIPAAQERINGRAINFTQLRERIEGVGFRKILGAFDNAPAGETGRSFFTQGHTFRVDLRAFVESKQVMFTEEIEILNGAGSEIIAESRWVQPLASVIIT